MTHQTFNNKRVIWESKTKQVVLIAISFLFVAAVLWTKEKSSAFTFWGTVVIFGGGGLFSLVRLLNPKNLFVTHTTPLAKEIAAEQFKTKQEDLGFFNFSDNGFSLRDLKGVTSQKWADIETIFGYKENRYTTDEICMDIFTNDNSILRLTESTPGWYQFQKRLSESILAIPNNWDGEIAIPAFETKLTLLFDRTCRTLHEAEAACYAG